MRLQPYLHESRHRHALNRARGSGGRFLNTNQLQESKAIVKTNSQDISGSIRLHLNTETKESEVHNGENHKKGISLTNCSDLTSVSTSDNVIHHQQQFRCPGHQSHVGCSPPSGGVGRTDGVKQFLSALR